MLDATQNGQSYVAKILQLILCSNFCISEKNSMHTVILNIRSSFTENVEYYLLLHYIALVDFVMPIM